MAEMFGTVVGALGVVDLFNNCVDCFEYVQMGRHFGRDYERCQLKLKVAQLRLSRWGEAIAINEDLRFAMGAKPEDLVQFRDGEMQPVFQRLCRHLESVVRQRQKQTSLVKKAACVLYDGKNFDRLVEQITGFVDDLEKICPVEAICRQLVQVEIEEVDDEPGLMAISDAASGVDSVFAAAAAQKAEGIAVKNRAGKINAQGDARVRVGNEYAEKVLGHGWGVADQTTNSAGVVDATGSSAVHIGNNYGGRGILD
ncbi:prion-inhibition and propagation-domain-containing protein [Lasiosphaeria ovina]|uniref:Prion-inhibition and propagation-domain-containing protein n=1 Tax=Lasiosphaeria ovina TaxID=92902 RepID=A0AAE0KMY6_9PEZI|nr:prion-inhibition and propagation-domain-containing protein [Lasiosphaeria ovina]